MKKSSDTLIYFVTIRDKRDLQRFATMMMEEDDGAAAGSDEDFIDDSSAPPEFAMRPSANQAGISHANDGNEESSSSAAQPPDLISASSDPFDLLSMTSAPNTTETPATKQHPSQNEAPVVEDFDLLSSPKPVPSSAPVSAQDLFGGFETPAIDSKSQESTAAGSSDNNNGTNPKLMTAESGDLLGMANETPANDFLGDSFQSMPITPAIESVDPFADNDLFAAASTVPTEKREEKPVVQESGSASNKSSEMLESQHRGNSKPNRSIDASPEEASSVSKANLKNVDIKKEIKAAEDLNTQTEAKSQGEPQASVSDQSNGHGEQTNPVKEPAFVDDASSMPAAATPVESLPVGLALKDAARENQDSIQTTSTPTIPMKDSGKIENFATNQADAKLELVAQSQPKEVIEEDSAVFEEVELAEETSAEPNGDQSLNKAQAKKIEELEQLLVRAQQDIEDLQKQKDLYEKQAQDSQGETASVIQELQVKLQNECNERAEAEHDVKRARAEIKTLKVMLEEKEAKWNNQTTEWEQQLRGLEKENEALIDKARQELEDRKEHERRERVLANKLNNLKKLQTQTTDVEEVFADDLRMLKEDVAVKTEKIEALEAAKASLEKELAQEKEISGTRIEQLEKAVREEKHLNDERKKKMKSFIEAKAEELKEAKAEAEHYQNELNSGNQGMVDLNNRWKTLHAQWVQSQTRNRELQRDLNKMKKDMENFHRVGDSLNTKLSSSAKETEQHKNKRLAAKQELMSVLGQLEMEREITNKLRDSIRFTFTAKAQSQHQLLQENLTEFQTQLGALARRLGKPIPLSDSRQSSQTLPSLVMEAVEESEGASEHDDLSSPTKNGASKEQKRILLEITRLLAKLEVETQHISQSIMALTSGIEQMTQLISGGGGSGGEATCFTSLGAIFFGGGMQKAIAADQGRNNSNNRANPVRYGHSSHLPTESGTLT